MVNPSVFLGFGKQVLSGDSIVIRERAHDGPPLSRTIVLSNITCPKLARRPSPNNPSDASSIDEAFGWIAREFVRSKIIGKEVCYQIEKEISPNRAYGSIYLGKDASAENLTQTLVSEGFATVRKNMSAAMIEKNVPLMALIALEETAKANGKGLWSNSSVGAPREISWYMENPIEFFEAYSKRPLRGVVEFVRDASTLQVQLLPIEGDPNSIYYNIMITISGIKTPGSKMIENVREHEPFALDGQFFVESRLLQRDVTIIIESLSNQNFIGSILHPNGNIAHFLLREGLARCLEWNLAVVSADAGGPESYRAAERIAKEKRLRIWEDYQPAPIAGAKKSVINKKQEDVTLSAPVNLEYMGLVVEVGKGDHLFVKCQDGLIRKFFLSSIRPPRLLDDDGKPIPPKKNDRPLYEVPYVYEAREFLRKRLIGKHVRVVIDYVQPKPADSQMDDRICASVTIGDMNIAEALVQRGLASVVRYRNPNDARSRFYDSLLTAEAQAVSKNVGIFDNKAPPIHRFSEIAGNVAKMRTFLSSLQRIGSVDILVEFVVSASRLRVQITRENCLCTVLAAGIICPRPSRRALNQPEEAGEPFGDEAREYTRELCMQRELKFEADGMDKLGNLIGWISLNSEVKIRSISKTAAKKNKKTGDGAGGTFGSTNLSVLLCACGFATVNRGPNSQRSTHYSELLRAEDFANKNSLGLWSSEEFRASWNAEQAMQNEAEDGLNENGSGQAKGMFSVDDLRAELPKENPEASKKAFASRLASATIAQVTTIGRSTPGNNGIRFFVQFTSRSAQVHSINQQLNGTGSASLFNSSIEAVKPKRGLVCAARFSADNLWYRARVLRMQGTNSVTVSFIDFGNEETIDTSVVGAPRLAHLPKSLAGLEPMAIEYRLAYTQLPPDSDDRESSLTVLSHYIGDQDIRVCPIQGPVVACGKEDSRPVQSAMVYVKQVGTSTDIIDVGEELLREGLILTENVKMPMDICMRYSTTQKTAMQQRRNIWRYGDFRDEETA